MRKKKKSNLLQEKSSGHLPKRELSPYIKDLFQRSDKAIEKLKKEASEWRFFFWKKI